MEKNGIIIAVGRSRFGVKRNDVSKLVCSGREGAAVLAGVRVSLEKLFHWVVLSGVMRGWMRESKEMEEMGMDCEEEK